MLGFSKRTEGRLHRHLSMLQQGVDSIMPSQGQRLQIALAKFEKSGLFEFLCFAVITVNTIGLTVSTQRHADHQAEGKLLEDLELACCIFYVFELMIRLFFIHVLGIRPELVGWERGAVRKTAERWASDGVAQD